MKAMPLGLPASKTSYLTDTPLLLASPWSIKRCNAGGDATPLRNRLRVTDWRAGCRSVEVTLRQRRRER